MPKHGKKYTDLKKKIEAKDYELANAVTVLKGNPVSKVDTVEVHMRLGVDPKHADQVVRGNVVLPHGTGKKVTVLVFAKGENAKAATEAGADFVGAEDLVEKILGGWMAFDKVVATPDMMPLLGKLARILGPRGLMPNPKTGTVTMQVGPAIKELKAGKVSFRVDKGGNIHAAVAKLSFTAAQIEENARMFIDSVVRAKPATAKGEYIRGLYLAATMTPSIKLNRAMAR